MNPAEFGSASLLPHVTASLNAVAVLFLLLGFALIRLKNRALHRAAMIGAMSASALFLVFYLIYHFTAPVFEFPGQGAIRPVYYAMLISHVVLSVVVLPMIFLTARRAMAGNFRLHRGIARWTLPVWLYVSVTGLIVYVMLYHMVW